MLEASMGDSEQPAPLTGRQRRLHSTGWFRRWRRAHTKILGRFGWTLFLVGLGLILASALTGKLVEWHLINV